MIFIFLAAATSFSYNINFNKRCDLKCTLIKESDISYEKTFMCKNILNNYFNKMTNNIYYNDYNNDYNKYGEIFKISGIPAALIVVSENYVEEFILNKNLILMFDAGPFIRKSFYKNFKHLNINNALNKDIFLII